jgi:hypothetical protein
MPIDADAEQQTARGLERALRELEALIREGERLLARPQRIAADWRDEAFMKMLRALTQPALEPIEHRDFEDTRPASLHRPVPVVLARPQHRNADHA